MAAMKVLDLFSGFGGFSLGLKRAGFETVAFCEIEEYPRRVLKKNFPGIHIYKDVKNITKKRLEEDGIKKVDIITGGFPCQDLSVAGHQKGIEDGERSNLYTEMLRIVGECRPKYSIFENVTNLLTGDKGRWFARFLYDLDSIGYDAEWHCIPASELGASHHRDRVWIIAYPNGTNVHGINFPQPLWAYTEESRRWQRTRAVDATTPADDYARERGDYDDVPERMERLKGYGNAVVPLIPQIIGQAIQDCACAN